MESFGDVPARLPAESPGPDGGTALAVIDHGSLRLRDMSPNDLSVVRRIERAAYGEHPPGTPFEREIGNGLAAYTVAEWDGKTAPPAALGGGRRCARRLLRLPGRRRRAPILGFLGVWFLGDQLHITTIAVDPAIGRRQVGSLLMLHAFDIALEANLRTIALEVRASNERAQALYRRFGLREVGRRKRYYSDNEEDAVVMVTEHITARAMSVRLAQLRDRYRPASDSTKRGGAA